MTVVKAFGPGLVCRGYQYRMGLNVCETAKCVRDGFHACEDPLDCLDYYRDFEGNQFWLCEAAGDIDEDGADSKISCTRLTIIRRLNLLAFVWAALLYLRNHPKRPRNRRVAAFCGKADSNGFAIVEGDSRVRALSAKGRKDGDILGFHDRSDGGVYVLIVDGRQVRPGVYYGPDGTACADKAERTYADEVALQEEMG